MNKLENQQDFMNLLVFLWCAKHGTNLARYFLCNRKYLLVKFYESIDTKRHKAKVEYDMVLE